MKKIFLIAGMLIPAFAYCQQKDTLVFNPKREVVLEGGSNFRDLGGYPTKGGHTVKWGKIYRSADVSKLTDKDLQVLSDRHIATVCDLRGPDEIKNSPDRLPQGTQWINLPAGSENIKLSQMSAMMSSKASRDSVMIATYSKTDHLKAKYKPMFDQLLLLNGDQALMFHCSAGKDRTGIGAALVLSALGVDKKVVMADYEATNVFWKAGKERMQQMITQQGMDEKSVKALLGANPAYLENTFQAIEKQYGSMDKFLVTEMELTPEKLAALRTKYVN
ncbi:protein-tyrosine phosphatase [Pseudarcicella hirudinis]|uniref:Protein-tyrosine phosphatase n=1 Tax=Pseudarcicella hirudinis TaxID=1079859 RepID=A0A1I5M9H8_9BACT|nr:tyrosine-protein phosphatase [Pseudarcicella hirudinis]SFP06252.1 protein-tyrosine phosphatase [Pseudarcicella hirudinis]